MDAQNIRRALAVVHSLEKTSTNVDGMSRVKAVETVLRHGPMKLTHGEIDVLLHALNVSRTEITVQWSIC